MDKQDKFVEWEISELNDIIKNLNGRIIKIKV